MFRRLRKFFWTQQGGSEASDGRIYSASLEMPSGSTASVRMEIEVVSKSLPECIDLEMDDKSGSLHWTDRGELPQDNTLNRKQMIGDAHPAEEKLGRQMVSILALLDDARGVY